MPFDRGLIGFGLLLATIGAVMIAVRQAVASDPDDDPPFSRPATRAGTAGRCA